MCIRDSIYIVSSGSYEKVRSKHKKWRKIVCKEISEEWGGAVKLLIHDLSKEDSSKLIGSEEDVKVISDNDTIHTCLLYTSRFMLSRGMKRM